jgi:restriction endonuclease Mrr
MGGDLGVGKYTVWYVVKPFIIVVCAFLLLLFLGVSFGELWAEFVIFLVIAALVVFYRWGGRLEEEERLEQVRKEEAERQEEEKRKEAARLEQVRREEAERRERLRKWEEERREQAKRQEAEKRQRIEAMLHRDRVRDQINYMSGPEFERFMADLLRQKGYAVQETKATGDQGVDLIVPDLDGKQVVIQLKRWTGPVGNAAVSAIFAGMAHYHADEGWVITTSTFTRSARELARSTSVRLIDGKELADWLEGLREE